ncbi:myoneurin-like [Ceratina calcarata]|uniref:Myoneurin-like n=1 Tax=Ceratina calcarata TaxID=156304 RepID=A0AAJ7WE86_9HYME|nr:myoneurin-like [Ceratina calcarata]
MKIAYLNNVGPASYQSHRGTTSFLLACIFCTNWERGAELTNWFVKQQNEYDVPQTLFEFVASSYELAEAEERKKIAKTLICEECGKSFSRLDSLRRHEKNYCRVKGDRIYCRFCGKKFVKMLSLISHVKSMHSNLFHKSQTPLEMERF